MARSQVSRGELPRASPLGTKRGPAWWARLQWGLRVNSTVPVSAPAGDLG